MANPPGQDPEARRRAAYGDQYRNVTEQKMREAAARDLQKAETAQESKQRSQELDRVERKVWEDGKEEYDARRHPAIKIILVAVGTIGIILILASWAFHKEAPGGSSTKTESIEDFVLGLGVELFVGAVMLYFFIDFIYTEKDVRKKIQKIIGSVAVAIACCVSGYFSWPAFCSGFLSSLSVEIIGSVVAFALLENVIQVLSGKAASYEN